MTASNRRVVSRTPRPWTNVTTEDGEAPEQGRGKKFGAEIRGRFDHACRFQFHLTLAQARHHLRLARRLQPKAGFAVSLRKPMVR
jgi:hypothetical protein